MYNPTYKQLMVIVYDGICNSVFQSQVLAPLLTMLKANLNIEITLVSFEKVKLAASLLIQTIPAHDRLHLVIFNKPAFIGKISLYPGIWQLKRLLSYTPCHQIITRGPLAGWIVLKALASLAKHNPEGLWGSWNKFPSVTIQARGLCAEEYRYAKASSCTIPYKPTTMAKNLFNWWIYRQLNVIEFEVFSNKRKATYPQDVTIEAVSPALRTFLIDHFRAKQVKITLATKDIPTALAPALITQWRQDMRLRLGIPKSAYVYCYSGSNKPWQCADQTIADFAKRYTSNPNAFLLVLSQDQQYFEDALQSCQLPSSSYKVLQAPAHDLLRYLAAADAGYLFREPDIINWVSRPTKMLEYQAVGLNIIHNNTVEWLAKKGI